MYTKSGRLSVSLRPDTPRATNLTFNAAWRRTRTFAPARRALAKLFVRAERWGEAATALERVVQLDPNMAEAYYHLGRSYGRLKRPAEAQQALATFKRLSDTQKDREQSDINEVVRRLTNVRF